VIAIGLDRALFGLKHASDLPAPVQLRVLALVAVGMAAIAAALLVMPGSTYGGANANDILIFFDGADRILQGQVPNRDFHTPLGPLAWLFPALGLWLGGDLGGMFPVASAAFLAALLPLLIYVCGSRLTLPFALGAALFLLVLAAVPLNIGDQVDFTSFAMFYNRWCYVALSLAVLLALPRLPGAGSPALDAAALAVLLLFMFYTKLSYAAVGLVLALGLAILPAARRFAFAGLVLAAVAAVLVEFLWGGTASYLADARMAANASGALRGTLWTLFRSVLEDFTSWILFAIVLGLALARGARWNSLLISLLVAFAGLLLVNQNARGRDRGRWRTGSSW